MIAEICHPWRMTMALESSISCRKCAKRRGLIMIGALYSILTFSREMHLWSTVSLVDHLHPASTLPTQDLCALYLHTPHERPWLVTPVIVKGTT